MDCQQVLPMVLTVEETKCFIIIGTLGTRNAA